MDFSTLMLSMLFGAVGFGFLLYGKNAGLIVPMGAGVGLMICPYFIANIGLLVVVCCVLAATPFVIRGT